MFQGWKTIHNYDSCLFIDFPISHKFWFPPSTAMATTTISIDFLECHWWILVGLLLLIILNLECCVVPAIGGTGPLKWPKISSLMKKSMNIPQFPWHFANFAYLLVSQEGGPLSECATLRMCSGLISPKQLWMQEPKLLWAKHVNTVERIIWMIPLAAQTMP